MSKTPVLAASAALLALAVPTYGTEGVAQRIKDEQYSRFVSGASFCTSTPGFEVWTSARETWTATGGLDPRYWSGTAGASVVDVGDQAPDGSYYDYSYYAWSREHQPPVYGRVGDDQAYQSLYRWTWSAGLVDIDTSTVAPVVCRFAEEGDVAAADGSDVFFDANVTLEAFAYGEANRPDDSVIAPDAKLAIYMQDTTPAGDPGFFIVARDWNTGAAQHYRVWGGGWRQHDSYSDPHRYSGRIVVRAVRSVHKGKFDPVVPTFLVYLTDGRHLLEYDPDPAGYGRRPDAGKIQWDNVRDDFGGWYSDYIPFFQPLTTAYDMRLSKVSYSGGVRLGAYAMGTADPMRTTARWAADSGMIRLLRVDGTDIDGLRWIGSDYQYQGAEDVDAGAYTYYRDLYYDYSSSGNVRGSVSWRGVNGWGDGSHDMTPGGGCEITLGTNCFAKGRASLSSVNDFDSEDFDELEREDLPARTGERIGDRYVEVSDALAHAAVLGGTVKLLAYPMAPLVMPPLESDVTVDLNGHAVPGDWEYAMALGLANYDDYDWMGWVDAAGLRGGVVAYSAPGSKCMFALTGGSLGPDEASIYDNYVCGGLSVTGVSLRVTGVQIQDFSQICSSPSAIVSGGFESSLYVTNTALSVTGGYVSYNEYDSTAPAFMSNTALRVEGGSLSISGGDHGRVVAAGVPSVSISGGKLAGLELHDSTISRLGGEIGGDVVVSNNPAALTVSGAIGGRLDVADSGAVTFVKGASLYGQAFSADHVGPVACAAACAFGEVAVHGAPAVSLTNAHIYAYHYNTATISGRLGLYDIGSVVLSGVTIGDVEGGSYHNSVSATISNCNSTVVMSGTYGGLSHDSVPSSGSLSVYGGSLLVAGGSFYGLGVHDVSSAVISNSPAFYGSVSVLVTDAVHISGTPTMRGDAAFTAPSASIQGGTYGPDSLTEFQKHYNYSTHAYSYEEVRVTPPTLRIAASDSVISGGTFRVKLEGSGIRVAGGRFYWGPNPKLDESGVVLPVAGKKLVRVGGNNLWDLNDWKNTYWEVRDQ